MSDMGGENRTAGTVQWTYNEWRAAPATPALIVG